jgi:hypothetical protein
MKDVILIFGGESISEGIKLDLWSKIRGRNVWSINFAFKTFDFLPSAEVWVDISFFEKNMEALQKLYLAGVPCHAKKHQIYAGINEINTYETTRNPQEMDKKLYIGRMGLSGFFALSLAIRQGYENIYMCGNDFGSKTAKTHYYQDDIKVDSTGIGHPELYRNNGQVKEEVRDWEYFNQYNKNIINVSLESAIECFPKIDYPTFFKKINEN